MVLSRWYSRNKGMRVKHHIFKPMGKFLSVRKRAEHGISARDGRIADTLKAKIIKSNEFITNLSSFVCNEEIKRLILKHRLVRNSLLLKFLRLVKATNSIK